MATAEPATRPHVNGHGRKRPFSTWMKRLANLKNSASATPHITGKKAYGHSLSKSKKQQWAAKNNPYPESGHVTYAPPATIRSSDRVSYSMPVSPDDASYLSFESRSGQNMPLRSNKSAAPTLATNSETVHSDAGQSKAGTSGTAGCAMSSREGGGNSTFSSPNHSERSLTTTLTTIQSTTASGLFVNHSAPGQPGSIQAVNSAVHFSHQYPTSPPASALPSHLAPQPHPHSYTAATANNILTDNASILTLASSSKRRRRHSLDTDASVRALAPSSLFGNSRESLPLSVLSGNIEVNAAGLYTTHNRPSIGGLASAERASVYSSSGVTVPAIGSERNSYYAAKQIDGGSVRSGLLGHGRTDSINGSIGGIASPNSQLASPKEPNMPGKMSRRNSDWKEGELPESGDVVEDEDAREHEQENGTPKC